MFDIEIEPDGGSPRAESAGTGDGGTTNFPHNLTHIPVIPGSVDVIVGGLNGTDDGEGTLSGTGVSGTINYSTGAIVVILAGAPDSGDIPVKYKSWTLESRDVKDLGNVPTTVQLRNEDEETAVLLQLSEDRTNWISLFSAIVPAWDNPTTNRASARFFRAMSTKQCRAYGSSINLT